MARRALTLAFGLGVAIVALGAGFTVRQVMDNRTPAVVGTQLGEPFSLTDHNGQTITEAAFTGRPSLLFFGFTHCPEICPTTVYDMETWLAEMDVGPEEIGGYFVTIDPERDTPEFLKAYLEGQTDRVIGITGEPDAVRDMARSWRVYFQRRELGDGDYTMDHYASVFVLNAAGEVVDLIPYASDPDEAKAKIRAVLG
ncbi:electron transporter SCO1/SenC [Jannaschia pagri]|uniref:Electron transporter SCO1/SenC n=1 Tax=Jannaschia pagri TaxID=2829797 RepID=A0ABQ4NGT6_9RHOB|nr:MULTISPECIES: SCO family protein [unclassified Jannaschia]GIT90399.1 electron transporter SCO1/SenC [Jannaschia sp. AI_61]GIT93496.1 electron transporter SCO1/SenC [Jannaschia sp. AI_62]